MAYFRKTHELYSRRFSRNVGLGLVLAAFVVLVFGLTIAKIGDVDFVAPVEVQGGGNVQG